MNAVHRPPEAPGAPYADDVFDEVVLLEPERREIVLQARCGDHPTLLREVRALLAAHDAAESHLSGDRDDPPTLEPGSTLGPWLLAEPLGQGATSSVWKAFDRQLEAWSALKVIRPGLGRSSRALDAVFAEARAASRIISDHVVRVKRAGRIDLPDNAFLHYIEMELCAEHRARPDGSEELVVGESLAQTAPRDRIEAARLVMEAARGVDAAHRIGVLHRDVKPANILVTPVSRRALVADFGLAAPQVYPPPTADTPATATITVHEPHGAGALVGTPSYMAPEQAFGEPHTRASDVYGLGATLYTLLAGAPPYAPRPGAPVPALDVVSQAREGPPPPLRQIAPRVPPRLAAIVEKAMARSPRHRYATAGALADDLQLYLLDRPTSVDGVDPLLRLRLFVRRNRAVVSVIALLSAVLALFASAVWQLDRTRQEIEQEMRAAQRHKAEAEALAATAEQRARRAEEARQEAIADARAALAARDRAEEGAEAARSRARQEIELRAAAEEAKVAAERQLAGETDLRIQMQTALRLAEERVVQERLAREWIESVLEDETAARLRAEVQRDALQRELDAATRRVAALEEEIAELRALLAIPRDPGEPAGAADGDDPAALAGGAPTAGPWPSEPAFDLGSMPSP